MIGLQIQRELQIDQRQILAAAAGERCADAVQRLGRAGLCRIDQRRQLLAGLGLAQAFLHQRVPRQLLVEGLVDAGRRRAVLVARQPARIGVGNAKHGIVELVGALKARPGILFLARNLEDHAGVEILEDRIPFGAGQLVDIGDRCLGIAGAIGRPARQQRRHQIGDRPADRLVDVDLRGGIFLLLEVAHADHQPRDAVGLVHRQDAVGELDGLVNVAIRQRGDEGAVEQFVVLRVGAQRRAIERRSRSGVAFHAGVARGEIAAGRGQRFQIGLARELRRVIARVFGRLRRNRAGRGQCGEGNCGDRPTIETSGKHHGSPSSRMYGRILRSVLPIGLECKPKRRHLGLRQCRFWPSTARIRVGESIGRLGP